MSRLRFIEYVIPGVVLVILYFVIGAFDVWEQWNTFSRAHENMELDEVPIILATLSIWLAWIFYQEKESKRRVLKELEKEIAERQALELELRTALQSRQQFLANMSHELRTPLHSILGYASILSMEGTSTLGDKEKAQAQIIHDSGEHLLSLINDLLDMGKIDADRIKLHPTPCAINRILDECISLTKPMAIENKVHVERRYDDIAPINVDPLRIKQIFLNILSNAVKFSSDGTVTVSASDSDKAVVVSFADTGIGMSEEEIKTALEVFGQIRQSIHVRKYEGAGLGLPIANRLVELHGGSLAVDSVKGEGTTITITLPREAERAESPSA